jgi:cell division inhibitor SepF
MNFFGKKSGHFGEGDDFYDAALEDETLEEVVESEAEEFPPMDTPAGVGIGGGSLELKVVHSEKYEDVVMVAEHLLDHCTVVLDLNDANKEVRRRILDFLSGVAFAIGGNLNRVANSTYVITPKNVELSDDQKDAPAAEEKAGTTPRDLF